MDSLDLLPSNVVAESDLAEALRVDPSTATRAVQSGHLRPRLSLPE